MTKRLAMGVLCVLVLACDDEGGDCPAGMHLELGRCVASMTDGGTADAGFAGDGGPMHDADPTNDACSEEVCNGRDDDCDGATDEGIHGAVCGSDEGICVRGIGSCVDGVFACEGSVEGTEEVCNGVDDDCDGTMDEADPALGVACAAPGACGASVQVCVEGALQCMGEVEPSEETCNGVDDDCDGTVDEDSVSGGCGSDVGACERGRAQCTDGVEVCAGGVEPVDETCDGVDNDCDGSSDEGVSTPLYEDADGDGFGSGAPVELCAGTEGYAEVGGDCNDGDPLVRPNQTTFSGDPIVSGGFDYDCNGEEEPRYTTVRSSSDCTCPTIGATSFWLYSAPACGVEGRLKRCVRNAFTLACDQLEVDRNFVQPCR